MVSRREVWLPIIVIWKFSITYAYAWVGWSARVSNVQVEIRVLETGSENIPPQRIKPSTLRWLGHVAYAEHAPTAQCFIFVPCMEWKKPCRGQQMTWQRGLRKRTANLGNVGLTSSWLGPESFVSQLGGRTKWCDNEPISISLTQVSTKSEQGDAK